MAPVAGPSRGGIANVGTSRSATTRSTSGRAKTNKRVEQERILDRLLQAFLSERTQDPTRKAAQKPKPSTPSIRIHGHPPTPTRSPPPSRDSRSNTASISTMSSPLLSEVPCRAPCLLRQVHASRRPGSRLVQTPRPRHSPHSRPSHSTGQRFGCSALALAPLETARCHRTHRCQPHAQRKPIQLAHST